MAEKLVLLYFDFLLFTFYCIVGILLFLILQFICYRIFKFNLYKWLIFNLVEKWL